MKALVLNDIADIKLCEVPLPKPGRGEVLLKVEACGICSSDYNRIYVDGAHQMPLIPGHEFVGTVAELGPGVREELLGRRAAVYPLLPCRQCDSCMREEYELCSYYDYFGTRRDGGFAEYVAVPVFNLVIIPEDMSSLDAVICEPAAVCSHAVRLSGLQHGDIAVVIGTGTMAYLTALIAKIRGAGKVIVIGHSTEKVKRISKACDHVVNAKIWEPEEAVHTLTVGHMADVVYECVGSSEALAYAIAVSGEQTRIVAVGEPDGDISIGQNMYWKMLRKEIQFRGLWNSGYNSGKNDWTRIISYITEGLIDPGEIVTNVFPLEKYEESIGMLRGEEDHMKIVFVPSADEGTKPAESDPDNEEKETH